MKKTLLFILSLVLFCAALFAGCGQTQKTEWQPDTDRPWNFAPVVNEDDAEGYDIEFSVEHPSYPADVETIKATAVNKTGDTFTLASHGLFVEKYYENMFPNHEPEAAWVRLPYYEGSGMYSRAWTARADYTFTFETKYLQENCELTPGRYRFVVFLGDGPHYAYFEITE